jgi:hypothetical protein
LHVGCWAPKIIKPNAKERENRNFKDLYRQYVILCLQRYLKNEGELLETLLQLKTARRSNVNEIDTFSRSFSRFLDMIVK